MKNNTGKRMIMRNDGWYEALIDLLPGGVGIYEIDKNEKISVIYADTGVSRIVKGYSAEELKKMHTHIGHLLLEDDIQDLKREVIQATKENRNLDMKVRYHRSPEMIGWLWLRGRIMQKSESRTVCLVLLIDISEMKTLEKDLLIQQERYRILEETSSEILFEINPTKDELTYSLKELDGTFSRKVITNYVESLRTDPLVHEDSMPEFKEHLFKAMQQPCKGSFEYLSRISGYGYEWHCLTYTSVEDDSGRVASIFGRSKNIHDKVLKRQQLQREVESVQITNRYAQNYLVTRIHSKMKEAAFDCKHTLILIGINHFSKIVEKSGHSGGDAVIWRVSKLFEEIFPDRGIFGRKGNGKFMAYLEESNDKVLDEAVREFLSMLVLPENSVLDETIECSVGVASVVGYIEFDDLYEKADEALHLAQITKGTNYIRVS